MDSTPAMTVAGPASGQTTAPAPPPPERDLVETARIPTLEVIVTDASGNAVSRAAVNYRDLGTGLSGGGATNAGGRFEMRPGLQWAGSGWRFTWVGTHRVEVVAQGFTT